MLIRSYPLIVILALACLLFSPIVAQTFAGSFNLGGAENYALIFQGGGNNTLQITNVTINGNVGVGNTGKATVSGPSTIKGGIDFSASNKGQFSNNNNSNVITGQVQYSVVGLADALSFVNSLSQTLYKDHGTNVAINGNMTINASDGALFTVNGQQVHVFDATKFNNGGGQTLIINGSASDLVAINLGGLGNIQVHGDIVFTGGISADNVIFNVGGGDYTKLTGGTSLDINNNGGKAGIATGIFLDPNGAISVTNAIVEGRVFGGDSHDFQYVSGSKMTAPEGNTITVAPEPTTATLACMGIASLGFVGFSGAGDPPGPRLAPSRSAR